VPTRRLDEIIRNQKVEAEYVGIAWRI